MGYMFLKVLFKFSSQAEPQSHMKRLWSVWSLQLFPHWLTTTIDLPKLDFFPGLQLQKQLASLAGSDTKNDVSQVIWFGQNFTVALRTQILARCSNIMLKAWQVGLAEPADKRMSAAFFPRLSPLPNFSATLIQDGLKGASQRKLGFEVLLFMGRKIIQMLLVFSHHCMGVVWISVWDFSKVGRNVDEVEPLHSVWCSTPVCLRFVPFTHARQVFMAVLTCTEFWESCTTHMLVSQLSYTTESD